MSLTLTNKAATKAVYWSSLEVERPLIIIPQVDILFVGCAQGRLGDSERGVARARPGGGRSKVLVVR